MKNKKGLFGVPFLPVRSWLTPFINLMYAVICAPLFVYLGEKIIRGNDLYLWLRVNNGDYAFWMTAIAVFLSITAITFITTKLSIGVGVIGILSTVAHGIHYFKLKLRGEPFFPWDVFQAKEAADIVSDVTIEFTKEIWTAILCTIAFIIGAVLIDLFLRYPKIARYYYRLGAGIISCICLCVFINSVIWNAPMMKAQGIELVPWDEKGSYNKGGFFVTFMQNVESMIVEEPEGYSQSKIKEISDGHESKDGRTPNIICIMSEAFADTDQWANIGFEKEITPVINSIRDTSLTGMVLTPSYGGGTSISEYEVLSGNCASFLPQGTVPYMQFVTKSTGCFYPAFLKELGYTTVAIHPYKADFWCRNKAYPLMGFDKFITMDDFENPDKPRGYISDMEMTNMIIKEYEASKGDAPFFTFAVSMQNHASYSKGDYGDGLIQLDGRDYSAFPEGVQGSIRSYATGIYLADEALGALIDYFENEDSETVIVFFGDHQPHVHDNVSDAKLGLTSPENSNEVNLKLTYTTPYVIWNNFDADITLSEDESTDFSMYQLLPYMTEKLGLARPGYFEYLSEMRKTLPGHITTLALAPDGSPHAQKTDEQKALADDHWLLQYDMMFGNLYSDLWKPIK